SCNMMGNSRSAMILKASFWLSTTKPLTPYLLEKSTEESGFKIAPRNSAAGRVASSASEAMRWVRGCGTSCWSSKRAKPHLSTRTSIAEEDGLLDGNLSARALGRAATAVSQSSEHGIRIARSMVTFSSNSEKFSGVGLLAEGNLRYQRERLT